MDTGRMLTLNASQTEQLANSCAAYRSYAWQKLAPSPERNQTMRVAQTVQGRLSERQASPLSLSITEEERQALRGMLITLMQVYGADPPSVRRNRLLGDLAALRALFERSWQTQAF